ncbi:MAG: L,D-transpeptidase family protein [Synechococcus sp.]|nr:L,D-transpeptidase family protein [Synechococcus sp.]
MFPVPSAAIALLLIDLRQPQLQQLGRRAAAGPIAPLVLRIARPAAARPGSGAAAPPDRATTPAAVAPEPSAGTAASSPAPSPAAGSVVPLDPSAIPLPSSPATTATPPLSPHSAPAALELRLDRRRRLLLLLTHGRLLRRFPVAVGRPGWETPVGRFAVLEKQIEPVWEHPFSGVRIGPGPANPLGSRWIGFHRDCRGPHDRDRHHPLMPPGCVVTGFHGTPQRASVGRAVSHGCVRLYEEHVRELFDLVPIGTPVTVLP